MPVIIISLLGTQKLTRIKGKHSYLPLPRLKCLGFDVESPKADKPGYNLSCADESDKDNKNVVISMIVRTSTIHQNYPSLSVTSWTDV